MDFGFWPFALLAPFSPTAFRSLSRQIRKRPFMRPTIRLGRFFGIAIGLHYSWLIIAFLIVFSLAGHFQSTNPQWSPLVIWSLAGITALLFFASIVVHELSHAAVAKNRGMSVRSITLFALGGVANSEKESSDAKSEFWMAIVGPVT